MPICLRDNHFSPKKKGFSARPFCCSTFYPSMIFSGVRFFVSQAIPEARELTKTLKQHGGERQVIIAHCPCLYVCPSALASSRFGFACVRSFLAAPRLDQSTNVLALEQRPTSKHYDILHYQKKNRLAFNTFFFSLSSFSPSHTKFGMDAIVTHAVVARDDPEPGELGPGAAVVTPAWVEWSVKFNKLPPAGAFTATGTFRGTVICTAGMSKNDRLVNS